MTALPASRVERHKSPSWPRCKHPEQQCRRWRRVGRDATFIRWGESLTKMQHQGQDQRSWGAGSFGSSMVARLLASDRNEVAGGRVACAKTCGGRTPSLPIDTPQREQFPDDGGQHAERIDTRHIAHGLSPRARSPATLSAVTRNMPCVGHERRRRDMRRGS